VWSDRPIVGNASAGRAAFPPDRHVAAIRGDKPNQACSVKEETSPVEEKGMADREKSLVMLEKALSMEHKGKDFYQKAIETCRNDLGREIFVTLKSDEDVHIARITQIAEGLSAGRPWADDWKARTVSHADLKAFFGELSKKHHPAETADAGDVDALNVGIDFELRSVQFYESALAAADDQAEREFAERMIIEEKSHHRLLQDTKLYLTDPSSWFREHERGGLDGA
jgi:rubrerythrin